MLLSTWYIFNTTAVLKALGTRSQMKSVTEYDIVIGLWQGATVMDSNTVFTSARSVWWQQHWIPHRGQKNSGKAPPTPRWNSWAINDCWEEKHSSPGMSLLICYVIQFRVVTPNTCTYEHHQMDSADCTRGNICMWGSTCSNNERRGHIVGRELGVIHRKCNQGGKGRDGVNPAFIYGILKK